MSRRNINGQSGIALVIALMSLVLGTVMVAGCQPVEPAPTAGPAPVEMRAENLGTCVDRDTLKPREDGANAAFYPCVWDTFYMQPTGPWPYPRFLVYLDVPCSSVTFLDDPGSVECINVRDWV